MLRRSKLDYMKCNFLIRRRFRSLLVRSELFRINMRYQELFKKTADITDEGETICISLSLNNRIFIVFKTFLALFLFMHSILIMPMSQVL